MFRGDIPPSILRVCGLCLSSFVLHCFRPQGKPTLGTSRDRTGPDLEDISCCILWYITMLFASILRLFYLTWDNIWEAVSWLFSHDVKFQFDFEENK